MVFLFFTKPAFSVFFLLHKDYKQDMLLNQKKIKKK